MGAPNEDDASYCGEGQANTDALSKILAHRIPPPIARLRALAPRFGYYTGARQLTELHSPFRSRLWARLLRAPPADSISLPEVTHCSSLPCHPQTLGAVGD